MSRSQSKAEYGRFAHLFVGGIEWLLSQWQALTGGEETDLHSHAASGGGSGETVVYDHTATGTESSFGPITLPTDGRHAEVLITAGGSTAGFAFALVLNGDTEPSHYTGDGVPGAISREFDGIVGNANAVCQVQMLCADYRRVGWHMLPRHTSLIDGNTAFHQKDVGAYLVELALSNLTLLTYANDGVFDPAPLTSGSRVEVRIRS